MKKPWAGRFKEQTSKVVESFTESISFDHRLWKYDIEGSIAHAKMLSKQRIIPKSDAVKIIQRAPGDSRGDRNREIHFQGRPRRHPYEHRGSPYEKDRGCRGKTAYRTVAERSGGA